MDMKDGYISEDDFFNNLLVKITSLNALDENSESDTEEGFGVFGNAHRCFSSGADIIAPIDRPTVLSSLAGIGSPRVADMLEWMANGVASFSNLKCSPVV